MLFVLIYLDNCCFNRPYDDQSQVSIRLETEAKLAIQNLVIGKSISCLWSFVLDLENAKNPFPERKQGIDGWLRNCAGCIDPDISIRRQAEEFERRGIKGLDALHLAAAIRGGAQWFITTDRGIYKQRDSFTDIQIATPIEFMQQWENGNDN